MMMHEKFSRQRSASFFSTTAAHDCMIKVICKGTFVHTQDEKSMNERYEIMFPKSHAARIFSIVKECPGQTTSKNPKVSSYPYTRFGFSVRCSRVFSSCSPSTSSRCSPSPSLSGLARIRAGSPKMLASEIPDEVFRSSTVGAEFIASAATSPMESQQLEEIPGKVFQFGPRPPKK